MAKRGYLDSEKMAHTFDALRANDLVFSYVVNNWLLGKKPPAFDLLVWNKDSTRMPAKMHSQYLRSCYLRNEFASGEFEVDGHKVDPGKVDIDTYVLSAVDDHIVPWVSGYKTTQLLGGRNRFVLSTSGHIAGIVNPPSPKAKHWVNEDDLPADPQEWKDGATAPEQHLVGGLGHVDRRPGRSHRSRLLASSAARNTRRSRLPQAATSATARDLRPSQARTPTILTSPAHRRRPLDRPATDPHDCARDAFRRTSVRHHRSRRRPGTFPCTRAGASRSAGRGQRRRWRARRQRRVDLGRATRGRRDHRVRWPGRAEPTGTPGGEAIGRHAGAASAKLSDVLVDPVLAGELGVGDATVARAWRRYGVKSWSARRSVLHRWNRAAIRDVVGLYLHLEKAVVLWYGSPRPGPGPHRLILPLRPGLRTDHQHQRGPPALFGNLGRPAGQTTAMTARQGRVGAASSRPCLPRRELHIGSTTAAPTASPVNAIAPIASTRMTAPVTFSVELATRVSPGVTVSPLVAYLAHEDCSVNGNVYSVAGGRVARIARRRDSRSRAAREQRGGRPRPPRPDRPALARQGYHQPTSLDEETTIIAKALANG